MLFDVAVQTSWFLIVPALITVFLALAIFYLAPGLYRVFGEPGKRNRDKALMVAALGLAIVFVITLPPIIFVYL